MFTSYGSHVNSRSFCHIPWEILGGEAAPGPARLATGPRSAAGGAVLCAAGRAARLARLAVGGGTRWIDFHGGFMGDFRMAQAYSDFRDIFQDIFRIKKGVHFFRRFELLEDIWVISKATLR